MRLSYVICLASLVASLAVTAVSAAPAPATDSDTTRLTVDVAAAPVAELALDAVSLTGENVQFDTPRFTRSAANSTVKRKRTRTPKLRSKIRKPLVRPLGLTAKPPVVQPGCGTTTCTCSNDDECDILFTSNKCEAGTAVHNTRTSSGQCQSAD